MSAHAAMQYLEAIFIAPAAGLPMARVAEAEAFAGIGLAGDRYALGSGYYSKVDPYQITLIEGEVLDRIAERYGIPIHQGQHRRNLVTRGLRLPELRGKRFRIGDVLLEYDRPRPPCAYVERISSPGMTRALGEGSGIAASIIEGGILHENDQALVIPGVFRRVRRLP